MATYELTVRHPARPIETPPPPFKTVEVEADSAEQAAEAFRASCQPGGPNEGEDYTFIEKVERQGSPEPASSARAKKARATAPTQPEPDRRGLKSPSAAK